MASRGRRFGSPTPGAFRGVGEKTSHRINASIPIELMDRLLVRIDAMQISAAGYLLELVRRDLAGRALLPHWYDDWVMSSSVTTARPRLANPAPGAFRNVGEKTSHRINATIPIELMERLLVRIDAMNISASGYLLELVRRDLVGQSVLPHWYGDWRQLATASAGATHAPTLYDDVA